MATITGRTTTLPADVSVPRRRPHLSRGFGYLARHGVLLALSAVFMVPFIWMVGTSLKTNQQVLVYPPEWIPDPIRWRNYADVFEAMPLLRYAGNTAFICLMTIVGTLLSCTVVAYGFSRLEWRGRDALFLVVLASLMLPYQVTMIPLYLVFARLGWINTYLPLIVPAFFGNAFYIFLLRQFFLRIPRDYTDAARVEGANELRILANIILPLAKPALLTVALFQFLFTWNDFLGPLLYLQNRDMFTVSLGLANLQSTLGLSQFGVIMAGATLAVAPVLLAFIVAQRYFVEGIATSGVKG